jgi:hypothetical protein
MTRLALLIPLCLAAPALAQTDLPYHQQQRLVVIVNVPDDLKGVRPNGSEFSVLERGVYRFDALDRSQAVQTAANLQDGTGPFVRHGRTLRGTIRRLSGLGAPRAATVDLRLGDATFGRENVIDRAELGVRLRVRLDPMTTTAVRYAGAVARSGSFVPGTLRNVVTLPPQPGSIEVWHVKLTLEDHLPRRRPLEDFPTTIQARARPTPQGPIEAGPFGFRLTRDELNEVGAVGYDVQARFPMVEETDPYGHYVSRPYPAQLVVREDGRVWIRLTWGLNGRYHSWRHHCTAVLEPETYERLVRDGSVTVAATARYHFDDETQRLDLESPAQLELVVPPTPGLTAAVQPN